MEESKMVLRTEDLVKKYGKRTVVSHVSIDVKQGEIVGLLGPNGAGKTTSFYMTVGLITPNEGRIFLDDLEITKYPVYKRAQTGIGYLAQEASVFRQMSDTQTPQGIMTVLKKPSYTLEDILGGENPLIMILEDLQDPGNAGTILRTGEGAGVSGVLLTKTCVDITNPKVIRSTMGSVYRMPFLYVESVVSLTQELKERKIRTFAAHLKGRNSYDQESYTGGTAFLIGNEGKGLTEEASDSADCLIRIPMCGKVESLNAAMASGILMYEAARQRRG